jgi:hypothetical protein
MPNNDEHIVQAASRMVDMLRDAKDGNLSELPLRVQEALEWTSASRGVSPARSDMIQKEIEFLEALIERFSRGHPSLTARRPSGRLGGRFRFAARPRPRARRGASALNRRGDCLKRPRPW